MRTALPESVQARINAFMAMMLQEAADTDLDGILATLRPALGDLFESTPVEAHDVLADALVRAADRYGLADEVAAIAAHHRRHDGGAPPETDAGAQD